MSANIISFYIIAAFILGGGILAVTAQKIFRSAVWLLVSLTGIAALYFWMDLQFLAAVQIIVYIGGITVLIIFSIFLTAHSGADLPKALFWRKVSTAFIVIASFLVICTMILRNEFSISQNELSAGISVIGMKMLSTESGGYALPFEVVSILLLAAMIGCIAIAMKKKPEES
jgi:NADH-quinone oxidoreductase subunit J